MGSAAKARKRFEIEVRERRASRFAPIGAAPGSSPNLVLLRAPGEAPLSFVVCENNIVVHGAARVERRGKAAMRRHAGSAIMRRR